MHRPQGEIGGTDNRVASRDYYENPVFVAASPPSAPELPHCPACARAVRYRRSAVLVVLAATAALHLALMAEYARRIAATC